MGTRWRVVLLRLGLPAVLLRCCRVAASIRLNLIPLLHVRVDVTPG